MNQKACSLCKVNKPAADFNWRNKAKGWLRPECRECHRAAGRAAHAKDPAAYNAASKERKRRWRESKPASDKLWWEKNKDRLAERKRAIRESDPDAHRAKCRAAYHRNPAIILAATKRWTKANRAHVAAMQRRWYEANKPRAFENARKRRAMKRGRTVVRLTTAQIDARMSVFGHRCAYCGGPFEEVDHVIPLARGGMHCLANLRPACRSCNRRKWAKSLRDWQRPAS